MAHSQALRFFNARSQETKRHISKRISMNKNMKRGRAYRPVELGLFLNKPRLEYLQNLIDGNPWKAFVFIHATLGCQMRYTLYFLPKAYQLGKIFSYQTKFGEEYYSLRWNKIIEMPFMALVNALVVACVIDQTLRDKLINFNKDRNKMVAHIGEGKVVRDTTIRKSCLKGFEYVKEMNDVIRRIFFPDSFVAKNE